MTKAFIPFSTEQLEFLQKHYNINPMDDCIHVSDGIAHKKGTIWLKTNEGPTSHYCAKVWEYIKENPSDYCVNKPTGKFTYDE